MQGTGDHRHDREAGRLVYPVVSRRSGGLSLGVNLFPDAKVCSFDCPYCEVFPLAAGLPPFSVQALAAELEDFRSRIYQEQWSPLPVRDICISGNGEPTASPRLGEVLEVLARFRRANSGMLGSAGLVLITNSTGFFDPAICDLLERFSRKEGLVVWAKLDAGGADFFSLMSGSAIPFERIAAGLLAFARRSPVVIQTMLCAVDGRPPADADFSDYVSLVSRFKAEGALITEAHLYTLARPSPSGRCSALSDADLNRRANEFGAAAGLRVRAFGAKSEIRSVAPAENEILGAAPAKSEILSAAPAENEILGEPAAESVGL